MEKAPRLALLIPGLVCLMAGIWGGLLRLPLALPMPVEHAQWITYHGPLMVCGFLGTVIGLERAVGLRDPWTYLAPLLTAAGAAALVSGITGPVPPLLITAGSAAFFVVTLRVVQLQRALFTSVMATGALTWLIGNGLWIRGWTFAQIVPWWIAFLALTILGERLDLSRFQRPTKHAKPLLISALVLFLTGVVTSAVRDSHGLRLTGAGLLGLATWLGCFDLARRTLRQPELTRFMSASLLLGYGWMAVAGMLLLYSGAMTSGPRYDAALHAFFVGFVFSMIFGHAPVIFPAVLNLRPAYRTAFYAHLVLLHAGLMLRVAGDLSESVWARQWGGVINAVAIAVFLANTLGGFAFPPKVVGMQPKARPHGG